MHVLIAILGVLALVALWWLRRRMTGTANDVSGMRRRVPGAIGARAFRKRSDRSPYATIDDPQTAGAVILVMVAYARGTLSVAGEMEAERAMRTMMGIAEPRELYIFAKWVAEHTVHTDDALRTLAAVMTRTIDPAERARFLRETQRIAEIDGALSPEQADALGLLGRHLGVAVDA